MVPVSWGLRCVRGLPCPTVTAADNQAMCCPRFFNPRTSLDVVIETVD